MYPNAGPLPALIAVLMMLSASSASVTPPLSLDHAVAQAVSVAPRIQSATARWRVVTAETQARLGPADPELELEFEGMMSAFDLSSHEERSIGLTQRLAMPLSWFHERAAGRSTADAVHLEHVDRARLDVTLETATAEIIPLRDTGRVQDPAGRTERTLAAPARCRQSAGCRGRGR